MGDFIIPEEVFPEVSDDIADVDEAETNLEDNIRDISEGGESNSQQNIDEINSQMEELENTSRQVTKKIFEESLPEEPPEVIDQLTDLLHSSLSELPQKLTSNPDLIKNPAVNEMFRNLGTEWSKAWDNFGDSLSGEASDQFNEVNEVIEKNKPNLQKRFEDLESSCTIASLTGMLGDGNCGQQIDDMNDEVLRLREDVDKLKTPDLDEEVEANETKGKFGEKVKKFFKIVGILMIIGGVIGGIVGLVIMAEQLTGCYKFGPTLDDQTGPITPSEWASFSGKSRKAKEAANCGCSQPPTATDNCSNDPDGTLATKTQCCGDDKSNMQFRPFCANGPCPDGAGCNNEFPLCVGTPQKGSKFIYYGYKKVTPASIIGNLFKDIVDGIGGIPGGFKKIIMWVGIGIGGLLIAYLIFVIIRSYNNKDSNKK